MPAETWIRAAGPLLLALVAAWGIDRLTRERGLQPPGFRPSWVGEPVAAARRALALATVAGVLWVGIFAPLGALGSDLRTDLSQVGVGQLFLLHGLFAAALAVWYLLGFAGTGGSVAVQLGLRAPRPLTEIGVGLAAGIGGWLVVLAVVLLLGWLILVLGGEGLLAERPPPLVAWLAGLPVWVRLAVSLSAGLVEETFFFRGFLQPRVGVALSTALFALAHAGYAQPLMLVGVTLLSLFFAQLVRWRRNIWPAMAAHALFNAIQLLIVVPLVLELAPGEEGGGVSLALAAVW